MKRTVFLPALAAFAVIALLSSASAQPDYHNGQRRNYPDYNQQQQMPAAPVIIIDADGRRSNNQYRNFDNCYNLQTLSRKQRKRLEKKLGYVPPLAIYVPDQFVNHSGVYMYNNNIVYRKDRDGFFHLDSRYFNDNWDDYSNRDDRYDRDSRSDRDDRRWNNNYPSHY